MQNILARLGITTHTLVVVAAVATALATFIVSITGDLPGGWQATAGIIASDLVLAAKAVTSIMGKSRWESSPVGQANLANQVGVDPSVVTGYFHGQPDGGAEEDEGQPADIDFPADAEVGAASPTP